MKLVVLAVGRMREEWVRDGCDEYLKRIRRHLPIEIVEVKDGEGLLGKLPARHRVVALDERGKAPSSAELAGKLAAWMNSGAAGVTFLVGGADGLPVDAVGRADETLSLSRLTLPHRLARLVLIEQLYRGLSILRGEPYHRA